MRATARRFTGSLLAVAAGVAGAPEAQGATADAGAQPRIVGGQPASRPYPFQALLEARSSSGTARCGGALVAARFIVTAAHCMSVGGSPATEIDITLGAADVSGTSPNFAADRYLVHPGYSGEPSGGYDVAVVRMTRAASSEQLRLLRPQDAPAWAPGVVATVIGWGRTDDGQPGSDQLREVQVPMYSDESCAADFRAAGMPDGLFAPLTMVCAGGKDGRDACHGDSGGPLLVPDGGRFALGGVISFGAEAEEGDSCASGLPGVYSRVGADPLNAWVRSQIPQVEIEASPALPEPGRPVRLTAAGSVPYERFEWDLDNDGSFDDDTGATAAVTLPLGVSTVGVRALRGSGDGRDAETRRIDLDARFRSAVSFPAAAVTVREGRPVSVTVAKTGSGAGGVTVTPVAGSAGLGSDVNAPIAIPLEFGAAQSAHTVSIATVDDREAEGRETFTVDLGGVTGELVAGAPTRLTVTIADDDAGSRIIGLTRSGERRRGRVAVRYRLTGPGTANIAITDRHRRVVLATARRRHASAGRYTAALRLTRAARKRLRGRRVVKGLLVLTLFDGGDPVDSRALRFRLRR